MASTTQQVSKAVLRDATIPNGKHQVNAWEHPGMETVEFAEVDFVDGIGEINFNVSANRPVMAAVSDLDVYPPVNGALVSAMTEGVTKLFANETLRIEDGLVTNCVFLGNNAKTNTTVAYELPDGSFVSCLANTGAFQYSPRGAYDHLQTGESATVTVPYYLDEMQFSEDASEFSFNVSRWLDNGDGSFTKTQTGNTSKLTISSPYIEPGKLLNISGTVQNNTGGAFYVTLDVYDAELGYNVTHQTLLTEEAPFNGDFDVDIVIPDANIVAVALSGSNYFNGSISNINVVTVDIDSAPTIEITILPSPDVSDFIIQPDSLSGTSWTKTGSGIAATFTKTAGDTSPLSVPITLAAGKILECAYSIASLTAGSITVELVGDTTETHQYTLGSADRDVLYFTVPANLSELRFVPTSDFDGVIEKVYVRELLCSSNVPTPRKIDTESTVAGELMVSPVMPLPDLVPDTFDVERTGELNYSAEFGLRITSTSTFKVQDAYAVARRSSISTKGGDYCVIDNVDITGGYSPSDPSGAFQQAFITSDDTPPMYKTWVWNTITDGLLEPQDGSYSVNGDHSVFNTTLDRDGHKPVEYSFNDTGANWPDAAVDLKIRGFHMHCDYLGGWRTFRTHHITTALLYNTVLQTVDGSQCALHLRRGTPRTQIFNCIIEGERILSVPQMQSLGAIAMDTESNSAEWNLATIHVMKTFPRIPDEGRMHFTSLELQIQYNQSGEWVDISDNYGLMFIGSLRRTFTGLTSGTHNLRMRAINGEHVGSWYTETGVSVL